MFTIFMGGIPNHPHMVGKRTLLYQHCSCIRITGEICPGPPGALKFSSTALRRLNLQRSRRIRLFLRGHGLEAEEARTKLEKMETTCHNENNDD